MAQITKGSQYIAFALIFLLILQLGESSSTFLRVNETAGDSHMRKDEIKFLEVLDRGLRMLSHIDDSISK
jgi:hypothetical protein